MKSSEYASGSPLRSWLGHDVYVQWSAGVWEGLGRAWCAALAPVRARARRVIVIVEKEHIVFVE